MAKSYGDDLRRKLLEAMIAGGHAGSTGDALLGELAVGVEDFRATQA